MATITQSADGRTTEIRSDSVEMNQDENLPPAYEHIALSNNHSGDDEQEPFMNQTTYDPSQDKLPSYELATSLPTYDDIQPTNNGVVGGGMTQRLFGDSFHHTEVDGETVDVGTDGVFLLSFIFSFFFNWFGILFGFCFFSNLAIRYGILSGFGCSIMYWLLLMKYTQEQLSYMHTYVWWIFLGLACVVTIRGITSWLSARQFRVVSAEQREDGPGVLLY